MTEPRLTVDTITSDQLDQLHADRYELATLRDDHNRLWTEFGKERDRAEQSEAAITRVRALHRKASHGDVCVYCAPVQRIGYDATWPCDTIRALDEPKEPTT